MNAIPVLALTFSIFLASCKKTTDHGPNAPLEGNWELRKIVANLSRDYPPGSGNYLKLTSNTYEIYYSDTLYRKGTYSVVTDYTVTETLCLAVQAGHYTQRIIYDNNANTESKEFFEIDGNNMTIAFGEGCSIADADGHRFYVKK